MVRGHLKYNYFLINIVYSFLHPSAVVLGHAVDSYLYWKTSKFQADQSVFFVELYLLGQLFILLWRVIMEY